MSQASPLPNRPSLFSAKEQRLLCYALLFFIVGLAFWLRQARVTYGLPLLLNEDEPIYYYRALKMGFGEWPADYFKKPGFFLFFYGIFYYLKFLLSANGNSWHTYWLDFWRNPSGIAILGRSISLAFACASVWSIGILGKRLFGWVVGLTAALWLALNGTHLGISSIVIADIPAVFCILLSAHFALDVYDCGTWRDYLLCALAIALTISFKYNVISISFLIAAHGLGRWKISPTSPSIDTESLPAKLIRLGLSNKLWVSLASIALLFGALNPMSVLHYQKFLEDLTYEKTHMLTRQGAVVSKVPVHYFAAFPAIFFRILPKVLGWPIYILGFSGLFFGLIKILQQRRLGRNVAIFIFPVVFLFLMLQFRLINAKYLLPISVFWILGAAFMLERCSQRLARKFWLPVCSTLIVAIGFSNWLLVDPPPAIYNNPDTRQIAAQVMLDSIHNNQTILLEPDTLTLDLHQLGFGGWSRQRYSPQEKRWVAETVSTQMIPVEASDQFLVVNLGAAKKIPGTQRYDMRFPDSYYHQLAQHYRVKNLLTPFPIKENENRWRCRWAGSKLSDLYAVLRSQKGKQDMPGPVLMVLERIDKS